jgi:outer membrane receptor protein involved in Fe transport
MITKKKCVRGFTLLFIAIISFHSIAKGENAVLSKEITSETDQGMTSGKIIGTVKDSSGNLLVEAGIEAVEADKKGTPEARGGFTLSYTNGKYVLELPPGTYELKATFPNYETTIIKEVKVKAGKTISLDIILSQALVEIDEMKVVAKAKKGTEMVQLLRRKTASNIMDNISAETIAKIPDSDVAGILARMPGVSMDQGKYLQARGLPKRYNRTMLNKAVMPTTKPNEKVVPLDLFPTDVVESINVVKSYSPNLPANFSGGLAMIETKSIPDEFIMKLSASTTYNTETTFQDYLTYRGGKRDWLGYDDGTRKLPGIIPDQRVVRESPISKKGFPPLELERFGESFKNNWKVYTKYAKPDQSYSFLVGNKFFDKLGGILVLRYKNETQNRKGEHLNTYSAQGGKGELKRDNLYDFERSSRYYKWSGLLNLGLELTPDHTFSVSNFYNRNATNEVVDYGGFNSDKGTLIQDTRLRWIEEEIYSVQLKGDHHLDDFLMSDIDWRYTYSIANMDEPDMREYLYEFNEFLNEFVFADEAMSGLHMWTKQGEDMHDFSLDWTINFYQWSGLPAKLQFGPAYVYRDRDFSSRRFRFIPRDASDIDLTQPIEDILRPWNINQYNYEITETTRPTDSYGAKQEIKAGYLMLDLPIFDKLRVAGGARWEWSDIELNSFDIFDPDTSINTKIKTDDIFPSINLTYSVMDDMSIRLGYSETTSRPEFHELAPFEFTDVRGGRTIRGNPNLKPSYIKNYDFRWEWFMGGEDLLAVSIFYKDFKDAIEKTLMPAIELRSSFTNAKDADLFGVEFELRKNMGFISHYLRHFNLIGNYIYSDSETTIEPSPSFVPTSLKRPMVGQADQIYNITLEYDNPNWGFTGRFLYRFIDQRIDEIGGNGLPDIILEESNKFDLVFIKKFKENFEFKLIVENLSNEGVKFTQGGKLYHKYKEGIDFKLGLSYKW